MSTNTSPRVQPPRKGHRAFLWFFLVIQVIFLSWVVFTSVLLSQSGRPPGAGLQMGLWTVTDVLLAVIALVGRAAGR